MKKYTLRYPDAALRSGYRPSSYTNHEIMMNTKHNLHQHRNRYNGFSRAKSMCAGVKGAWKWSSHGIPGYDGGGRKNSCVTFILEWYQSCSLNGIVVSFLLTLTHIDTNISQDILHNTICTLQNHIATETFLMSLKR